MINVIFHFLKANLITPPIGPPLDAATKTKQDEIQSRIIDILNKKKEPEPKVNPEISASLQKAIDSLFKTGPSSSTTTASSAGPGSGYGPSSSGYGYSGYQGY